MKKLLTLSFIFTFHLQIFSQNTFQAKFSGAFQMGDHMSTALSDGSIVFCYDLISSGDVDLGLTRIDANGNIIWTKRISGTSIETGYFPQEASDGNIFLAGHGPGESILLTKVDLNGTVLWSTKSTLGTMPFSPPIETHDQGFAVIGSNQTSPSTYDTYLFRTDSLGNFLWGKSYGAFNTGPGRVGIETADKGFLLIGSVITTAQQDLLVIKTDSVGNLVWSKQYGSAEMDVPYSISQTSEGGYLISLNVFGGSSNGLNFLKIDPVGTIEWVKNYSGIHGGKFSKITNNNEIVADGSGFGATVLIKTDSVGNLMWNKYYSDRNTAATLDIAPDNGFVMLAPNPTFDTLLVVKTDEDGNSGCEESTSSISVNYPTLNVNSVVLQVSSGGGASAYNLTSTDVQMNSSICNTTSILETKNNDSSLIYPNPATNELIIQKSDLQKAEYVFMNSIGQVLFNGKINAIIKKINVSNLNPGLYYIRISDNENVFVKKILIER